VHGVMNTDNMSILGETIDYGPYGWLEDFDPDWTPNTTDAQHRRYRYGQQPAIAQWNLMQLANALLPLIDDPAPLEAALSEFAQHYQTLWQTMMANKLGLHAYDANLVDALHQCLTAVETDMTRFYRLLAQVEPSDAGAAQVLQAACYRPEQLTEDEQARRTQWLQQYHHLLQSQGVEEQARRLGMNRVNPKYVLRNYLAQLGIDAAAQGDFTEIHTLLEVLRHPYDEQPEFDRYAGMRPDWARTRVGCSMLSCSS